MSVNGDSYKSAAPIRPCSVRWSTIKLTNSIWLAPKVFCHAPREMALQFYRYCLAVIRGELPSALPVFGRYPGGTAKRLREMALVGETRLERNKRNGFLAK